MLDLLEGWGVVETDKIKTGPFQVLESIFNLWKEN